MLLSAAAAAILLLGAGPALADPITTPPVNSLVAVSGQTLQYVCDQFSTDDNRTQPAEDFYCWDPVNPTTGLPGDTIETKNDTNCEITRPNGSGAGIAQLQKDIKTKSGVPCIDMVFSDRGLKPTDGTGLAAVLLAENLVSWASNTGGNSVTNLTDTDLTAIYTCNASLINASYSGPVTWTEVGGTSTNRIVPVLPATTSAVHARWLADLGISTPGSCVVNGTYSATSIAPNEGTNAVFTAGGNPVGYRDVIVPFEANSYACQLAKTCPSQLGNLVLRDIDGKPPFTSTGKLNVTGTNAFPAKYIEGEYVITYNAGTAAAPRVPADEVPFLGQGSSAGWICGTTAQNDVQRYGFGTPSNCGALTGQ